MDEQKPQKGRPILWFWVGKQDLNQEEETVVTYMFLVVSHT